MEYKKITISLPEGMYNEAQILVEKGYFSNISDLIRSGIRHEFREMQPITKEKEEEMLDQELYNDKELISAVKENRKAFKEGKGRTFANAAEMKKYLDSL
ncbi:MAG: ribbon-helix-helix domain-containing protein [Candidatus Altiarchaeia archaeon]